MSDTTTVTLRVLSEQAKQATTLFTFEAEEENSDSVWTAFVLHAVNYGNLEFEEVLQQAGIPYDKEWGDGCEYYSGTEYCRFTPEGDIAIKEIYDSAINPDIDELMKRIDDPVRLSNYILAHKEETTVAELDEQQIVWGKNYLAKKLIAPT